ncbi:MAG: hypothetical protein CEN87_386 [Parcubacteria group bacterium Licking1014_1]|nr:MAG: hypothetical protein CEN87_386 [Parcubacteria group bacterium Licking1014_1]
MEKMQKNQVNRCFGKHLKNPKESSKPKALPLTEQQREEKARRTFLAAAATERKKKKKKTNREIGSLLKEYKGRYSLLQLLQVIKLRYPSLLMAAIERVEGQRNRNELSMEKIAWFETFKASLKQEE